MNEPLPYRVLMVLRPQQWVKNFVCFAGLIFSGKLLTADAQLAALLAFLSFCAAASAVYLFNDFCDRRRDAENPRTAARPFAAGTMPLGLAIGIGIGLVAVSVGVAWSINRATAGVVAAYLVLNLAYSVKVKSTIIVDVLCVAVGFVLRVLAGVYAVEVLPTAWIVLCMFVLALFLGFCKRRGELSQLGEMASNARPVLRKYTLAFLDGAALISAGLSIITYAIYTTSSEHSENLVVTVVPVTYCVFRYYYKVIVEDFGEAPEQLLYRDPFLWLGILAWVALVVFVVYLMPRYWPNLTLFAPTVPHQKP